MRVRPATSGDARSLAALSVELGYPTDVEAVAQRLAKLSAAADHAVYITEAANGAVVGWIHVFGALRLESVPFAEIGGLIVSEAHRRRGIGKLLIERARQWTSDNGLTALRVRTRIEREDAHRFYRSVGFRRAKTQQIFVCSCRVDDKTISSN